MSFGVVNNIPSKFSSVDLRNYFSDFVERRKLECFHFKHRPEVEKDKLAEDKTKKSGTCCCVFQAIGDESLSEFISKYHGTNWIDSAGNYSSERCKIQKIQLPVSDNSENSSKSGELTSNNEKKYRRRHAPVADFSVCDLMSLSELNPPRHIMPRGNIGTTVEEFRKLINDCKLPPRIIKKLGLTFPTTGSTRRYGNVPMRYMDNQAKVKVYSGESVYTANGDSLETNIIEDDNPKETDEPSPIHHASGENSDSGEDNDRCEEWERHEALHSDVTSQGRAKERLFEEKIELKWEKGGSGLVFYTDAQFWDEKEGDFDEQTTDDWDVDMSKYYEGDDENNYMQLIRKRRAEIKNASRGEVPTFKQSENNDSDGRDSDDEDTILKDDRNASKEMKERDFIELMRKRRQGTSKERRQAKKSKRGQEPKIVKSKTRGAFEQHTRGVGRILLEKRGWKDGEPLGPSGKSGAITDPVELDGQHPKLRKGLGFHGKKLLTHSMPEEKTKTGVKLVVPKTHKGLASRKPQKLYEETKFWGTRSVEPNASHAYMFPQYHFNLINEYKELSKTERRKAVPGSDDGVVITTIYDDPLDIDVQNNPLRSRPQTSLKHRKMHTEDGARGPIIPCEEEEKKSGFSGGSGQTFQSRNPGSKLVHQTKSYDAATWAPVDSKDPPRPSASSNNLAMGFVKFVSGGALKDQ